MKTIGERLKQERERLGLTQEEFANLAEVNKRSQINYEKGVRFPDARYLSKIAQIGVSVGYVLTGEGADHKASRKYENEVCGVKTLNVGETHGTYGLKNGENFFDDIEAFISAQKECLDVINGILKKVGFDGVNSTIKNTVALLLQHNQITVQGVEAVLILMREQADVKRL